MIVTLTPNPSIDRTIAVPQLDHGEVNRATSSRIDPGGKGVNVSRALSANGSRTVAVMPMGGPEGHLMAELLDVAGVSHHGVAVDGNLRMNVAVVEPDGTTTKVNEPGPAFGPEETEALLAAVESYAVSSGWVVGCGSLPPGAPESLLADLVTRLRAKGCKVAIDSSGAPMVPAVAARPDLIKPNHEELEELVGTPLTTVGDVVAAAQRLVAGGIGTVVVSLGKHGAVAVSPEGVFQASAHIARPVSTVGAGDSLLAGFLHAVCRDAGTAEALATGVAWGSAAVSLPGSRMPTPEDVAAIAVTSTTDIDLARPLTD